MTEFAGSLGASRLSILDQQNEERRGIAAKLNDILEPIKGISYLKPIPKAVSVYHSYVLLLELGNSLESPKTIAHAANREGIPLRATWSPLHRHPHFNPTYLPARGIPWQSKQTAGMHLDYASQSFPCGDNLIDNSILQIDIHPGTNESHLDQLASFLERTICK